MQKLTKEQIRQNYLDENQMCVEELGISDGEIMQETWLEINPRPICDTPEKRDDFNKIVNLAMHNLYEREAMDFFANEGKYNLHTPAYRWNIEQAIINRNDSKTMLSAALEYVENLLEQFA